MNKLVSIVLFFPLFISNIQCLSSPIRPFTTCRNATELMENVADLWWTVDDISKEITFELHVKTTGWISLGIALASGVTDMADMAVGWIDTNEQLYFEVDLNVTQASYSFLSDKQQDRYAFGFVLPVKDSTTQDWFGLQGREENNWTAIQFKRALDTKDSMDHPIYPGTNAVLFAYGLIDPNPDITYHQNRRSTNMLTLWKP